MLVGAEDPELEFVATPMLVVGPPGFVAGVFDAQPATPIASDTTATDRTRTTSLFIVSEYRLSFNFFCCGLQGFLVLDRAALICCVIRSDTAYEALVVVCLNA